MKDFWIVLPGQGRRSRWLVEQLTPQQALKRGSGVLAMAGPYRDAAEAAAAQLQAESVRVETLGVIAFARHCTGRATR